MNNYQNSNSFFDSFRNRIFLGVSIILLACIFSVVLFYTKPSVKAKGAQEVSKAVKTEKLQSESGRVFLYADGTAYAKAEIKISAEISGKIDFLADDLVPGARFKQGESLFKIEDSDYRLALSQSETDIAQAKLKLSQEKAEAKIAKQEWSELGDASRNELALRVPQLEAARANLSAAQARFELAKKNLERTNITAPFDLRIRERSVELGSFVSPGSTLAEAFSIDAIDVRLSLPEAELNLFDPEIIADSLAVKIFPSSSLKTKYWEGLVIEEGGELDPLTRSLNLTVRIEDPLNLNAGHLAGTILPGSFVQAEIPSRNIGEFFRLPRSALKDQLGKDTILLVDAESRIRVQEIELLKNMIIK